MVYLFLFFSSFNSLNKPSKILVKRLFWAAIGNSISMITELNTREISLFDFILFILKHKIVLFVNFFVISIVALTISLLLQKQYKSSVVFIPPGQQGSGLFSLIGNNFSTDLLGASKLGKRQHISILHSRELREKIIEKFDLIEVYKLSKQPNPLDQALKVSYKMIKVEAEEEGGFGITDVTTVSITAIDIKADRAADIANYAYKLLEEKVIQLNQNEYDEITNFISHQITECDSLLNKARNRVKEFQLTNKIYDIRSQMTLAIQTIAGYEAESMILEKQKAILSLYRTPSFHEIQEINDKIRVIKSKIIEIEDRKSANLIPGLKISIDLADQYMDLMKEAETYVQVKVLLRQQLEMAKVKATKNFSGIYLIDSARPAQYKFKPKRILVIIGIVFPYMLFLFVLLFLNDHYNHIKSKSPEKLAKIDEVMRHLSFRKQ